jgi:hypothetical protein
MVVLQYEKCVLALNRGDRRRLSDQWEKKSSEKIRRTKKHFFEKWVSMHIFDF